MWYKRDFDPIRAELESLPIKVLKGPRQVGKTSLLEQLPNIHVIRLDDLATRNFIQQNPRTYLDQFQGRLLIDEAPLAPEIFPELKRRVDEDRRLKKQTTNIWMTGSNQTLLRENTVESLAGRASYFDLNTLSVHELGRLDLRTHLLRGGWPELAVNPNLSHVRYLNDFISTFIDRDIVAAAGIERKAAFSKVLALTAARQGMLMNYSELAGSAAVDITTVQSWLLLLEENGLLRRIEPYSSNLNQRLIKSPKFYFEDVALASRLQGWQDVEPLFVSLQFGFLLEAIALGEITRFFTASGNRPRVFHLRTKEKIEIDFLVELPNQRFVAIEVKSTPQPFTAKQISVLDSLKINIIAQWVVTAEQNNEIPGFVPMSKLFERLAEF
jgi:predicted AAA+ superfamily ATPase